MRAGKILLVVAALMGLTMAPFAPALAGGGAPPTPAQLNGTWAMSTRTAPFEMTLSVDATNHVTGSFTASPGFVDAGTLKGRVVSDYVIFTLVQNNGAHGDGVLKLTWVKGQWTLNGPVKLDDDDRPIDNWGGARMLYKPVHHLGVGVGATAKDEVDVYDGPGGQYHVLGQMAQGVKARVLEHHPDGWCKLQGVWNGGDGWVADDHLDHC